MLLFVGCIDITFSFFLLYICPPNHLLIAKFLLKMGCGQGYTHRCPQNEGKSWQAGYQASPQLLVLKIVVEQKACRKSYRKL